MHRKRTRLLPEARRQGRLHSWAGGLGRTQSSKGRLRGEEKRGLMRVWLIRGCLGQTSQLTQEDSIPGIKDYVGKLIEDRTAASTDDEMVHI